MAPLPKRKHSTARKGTRKSALHVVRPGLSRCSNCGKSKLPHRTCPNCGFYK